VAREAPVSDELGQHVVVNLGEGARTVPVFTQPVGELLADPQIDLDRALGLVLRLQMPAERAQHPVNSSPIPLLSPRSGPESNRSEERKLIAV
jgi:hypothetical protein